MTEGLRSQIDRIGKALPGLDAAVRRRAAIGSWAAMVGAVILARAIDDPALSDEILGETRAWIGLNVIDDVTKARKDSNPPRRSDAAPPRRGS